MYENIAKNAWWPKNDIFCGNAYIFQTEADIR